eukprot:tig00021105_g18256.t1
MAVVRVDVHVLPIANGGTFEFDGLASACSRVCCSRALDRELQACAADIDSESRAPRSVPAHASPGKKRLLAPVMPAAKRGKENAYCNSPAAPAPADDACTAPCSPHTFPLVPAPCSQVHAPAPEPEPAATGAALSLADLTAALATIAIATSEAEAAELAEAEGEEAELAGLEWGAPAPAPAPGPPPRGACFAPVGAAQRPAARPAFFHERRGATRPLPQDAAAAAAGGGAGEDERRGS